MEGSGRLASTKGLGRGLGDPNDRTRTVVYDLVIINLKHIGVF